MTDKHYAKRDHMQIDIEALLARLMSSDPDFDDCTQAAELIQREIYGPEGYSTWREAALAERLRRIAATTTQEDAKKSARWDWMAAYIIKPDGRLDDELIACKTLGELNVLVDTTIATADAPAQPDKQVPIEFLSDERMFSKSNQDKPWDLSQPK